VPPLTPGETILLIDRRDKRYMVRLQAGGMFHFHGGHVGHDLLIGADEGVEVDTSKGYKLVAYRPRLVDHLMEMPRSTAIIYPKDIAAILIWADVYPALPSSSRAWAPARSPRRCCAPWDRKGA
jgi:tRNA (adenine57-N1/adenine58-N1)-methyltransferase catalytic subunit